MRRLSILAVVIILAATLWPLQAAAGGGAVWVGFHGVSEPAPVAVLPARSDSGIYEADLEIPGLALTRAEEGGRSFTLVEIPGAGRIGSLGGPMLPAWRRFVEIPEGAQVKPLVTVLETEKVDLAACGLPSLVYPLQHDRPKCTGPGVPEWRFSFKESAYHGWVQAPVLSQDGPYTFRDHRVVRVTVAPVRYDADNGILEVATRIRLRLEFTGGDTRATSERKQRLSSSAFDGFLAGKVLNLNFSDQRAAGWHYPTAAPVEFLIITPPQFVADLQPFVDWKTSCGFHVTVATTDETGTTTDAIKSYITGLYNSSNPPVYILMIGDSPTPLATYVNVDPDHGSAGGSDLPFVQMDGDLYPDMIIARWPVDDSTELAAMRDKILAYENPSPGDTAWLNRALFMEGDGYQGAGVTTHEDVIADLMGPSTPNGAETILWLESENHTVADLNQEMTTGVGFAVYSAHSGPSGWAGPPPYSTGDTASMTNTGHYPLGFGHSCQSNMWAAYDDVFGEDTLIHPDKGFVSYWGGSNSTYWDGDDWLERGFFDSFIPEDMPGNLITLNGQFAQGAACYSGLTEVSLQAGKDGSRLPSESYYWYEYNLDGDPTLDPFTRQPIGMTVTAPGAVAPAGQDITVSVSDSARGPVAGALVAASQEIAGNVVLLGAGYTDGTGTATFHIDAPTAGQDLLVRVTAHNHLPADQTVVVAAGSDGVVLLDAEVYRCDGMVGIQLFDDDLAGQGTQDVTLSASPSGGSVTVTLTEVTGGAVVKFVGFAALGTDLAVADGDTLTVTYVDADDGAGGTDVPKTDTARIDCEGPVVSNVAVSATQDAMTITFTTDEPGTTTVIWGASTPPATVYEDTALVTDHSVTLAGLSPCTRYYFEIVTEDGLGNQTTDDNGGSYYHGDSAGWSVVLDEPLDTDPGWSIDNGGSANGWAFGQPQGLGGQYGEPDPTSGHTGANVYGVNLEGDYDNGLAEDQLVLTAPAVDCTEMTTVQLHYWRWLGVESPTYDHARVQMSVDGGPWSTVWENTSRMDGGAWEEEVLDVTSQAAGHGWVQFRWTQGATDSSWQFCGWNIDDIRVEGSAPCQMCVDPPAWTMGGDGVDAVAEVNDGTTCTLTGLDVDWSPAESSCADHVWYRVWVVKGSTVDFGQPATFEGLSGTHLRVMGLSPGQEYAVAVRAYDEYGNEDGNTHVLTVTPTGDPSGDVDGDADVDALDIGALLDYFFAGTVPGGHVDVDCTGSSDASDLVREIQYQGNGLY
jgi:hypothetical protein